MLKVYLNKGEEDNVLKGYPWIFNNEVNGFDGKVENGEVVSVYTFQKVFLAYGFINTSSKIMIRVLSLNIEEKIDKSFFKKRIEKALEHRNQINFGDTARLVFSEADFLPGLIIDKYKDVIVVSFLSLGMDKIKDMIVEIIKEILNPVAIFERNDSPVRLKEGLELEKKLLYGVLPEELIISENDIKFYVDVVDGQKTGFFLDQKMNRDYLKHFVREKAVLDCFSNIGGFGLNAIKNGAKSVSCCDISEKACENIKRNIELNNFKNVEVICTDVFDYLRKPDNKNKFDVIILDPPAFSKSGKTIKKAYSGYKEINLSAMKMIKDCGYLLTFSCSQHMTEDLFMDMIKEAALDSKRRVQFIDMKIQSIDHPMLLTSEEQMYLKCVVLRVMDMWVYCERLLSKLPIKCIIKKEDKLIVIWYLLFLILDKVFMFF